MRPLTKCCWCLSLRSGVFVICVIDVCIAMLALAGAIFTRDEGSGRLEGAQLVAVALRILFASLCLYGVRRQQPFWILLYLCWLACLVVEELFWCILDLVRDDCRDGEGAVVNGDQCNVRWTGMFVVSLIEVIVGGYCLLVLWSLWKVMREGGTGELSSNDRFSRYRSRTLVAEPYSLDPTLIGNPMIVVQGVPATSSGFAMGEAPTDDTQPHQREEDDDNEEAESDECSADATPKEDKPPSRSSESGEGGERSAEGTHEGSEHSDSGRSGGGGGEGRAEAYRQTPLPAPISERQAEGS
ncbi:unnamed protein product [Vitrella brassicaformis CCMP3155]|uniref:Uncharacterized protein n=2 Tax=Vitrella brassicaformis TaxID=1169539 RepID=A0A0G4G2P1_VITBC|nr:unnamed protein product [Vitrella brassicaformis CCMP3155]|mmetsp:Transcript_50599/g.126864  ORF Transcript_50599/g.126864 Transcript_50599/m.126864 type:complete len:299 (+) Transcript_50599:82-978(+)|eukprot:CEM22128.1 unnamed protein product [Vitrella brassicaformis CCMP3155]